MLINNTTKLPRNRASERGLMLLWALFSLLVIAGVVLSGTQAEMALDKAARFEYADPAHARAVAAAGIVDAFAWFRRQQVQPVMTFAPQLDLAADPPINETADPARGLVRDYEIAPNLWGRYEVRLTRAGEPYVDADANGHFDAGESFTDTNGNGKWDGEGETHDISTERGQPGTGTVWQLVSHGYLYSRPRTDLPLDTSPNTRLAYATVATEIRRLTITPPAAAGICSQRGDVVTVGNRGRIVGGAGAAVAYPQATGTPTFETGSEVGGSPPASGQPSYGADIDDVFGVTMTELRSMADLSTSDPTSLPSPIGNYSLTVVDGDVTFDEDRPLRGTGIVVINGNCTLSSSSNSFFSGLLWVAGDLTVRAPAYLRGVFIAGGDVDVRGVGGDYAEINYDDGIISELLFLMGQYRHSKAIYALGKDTEAFNGGAE